GNIRRLPSKRYQATYLGPDGTRHNAPTTFDTKGDADAWLSMESSRITSHKWRPAPPVRSHLTLATFAETWLADRELTPRTRAEYTRMMNDIMEALGAVVLTELTAARVREWYATLDPSKPTARAHRYALLRTILNSAVRDELLEANPCRIERAAKAKAVKPIRPASSDELHTITEAMPERYRLMVLLAGWCAVRFGELTELRRRDVDTRTGTIRVRRGVTWVKDDDGIARAVVGLPKTDAGIRDVSVPPPLVPLIVAHMEAHALPGPDGLMFPNTDGHHMHHGSLYKVYRPARAAAGRPDLRWHDLRHTGATLAAQAGATTRELMDRLGHSTAAVAMRYQHVSDGRQAEIARRLGDMMGSQS
ncbi:MAG: tyrosine-type recombinase/integrase, partial [Arachnia sp.]